jgi:hypothetical protein
MVASGHCWKRRSVAAAVARHAAPPAGRIALLFTTTYGASANCKILWPELYTTMPITSERGYL